MRPAASASDAGGGGGTSPSAAVALRPNWPDAVASAVRTRDLRCVDETAVTAESLVRSVEAFTDGTALSADVERSLFESFVEDDYGGRLHLLTLRRTGAEGGGGGAVEDGAAGDGAVVGLVFWREVPPDEMADWLDLDGLAAALSSGAAAADPSGLIEGGAAGGLAGGDGCSGGGGEGAGSRRGGVRGGVVARTPPRPSSSSLVPVREESLRWLCRAASASSLPSSGPPSLANRSSAPPSVAATLEGLTHAWVKIELLAVRRPYRGRRYGTLLLACALSDAYRTASASHAVLHVAGGRSNVPAVRLYERFGFVGLPAGGGGMFRKPDRDLFVLGNIGTTLRGLEWGETLALPDGDGEEED